MPVMSVGGRAVIESNVVLIEDGAGGANLVLAGAPFDVVIDTSLAAMTAQAVQIGTHSGFKIGAHTMGNSTFHVMNYEVGGITYKLAFFVDVVDDGSRKHHRLTYTLSRI